jgi:hypothetical protein
MGDLKVPGLSQEDMARLHAEAKRLGLPVEDYARFKLLAGTDRAAAALAIRSRQKKLAKRDSVDLIREDRDRR